MMKRKTFDVDNFRRQINNMLAASTCPAEGRKSLQIILEDVLMKTGNYNGFRYLNESAVPEGHLPGINSSAFDKEPNPSPEALFQGTDNTRVFYF
jgi:hypothetical protein